MSKKPQKTEKTVTGMPTRDYTLSQVKQKQILSRIASSNPQNEQDYKRIIESLKSQNKKLHSQVEVMSEQVLKLIEKTKVQRPQAERMEKQIDEKKIQLQAKYKQFDQYKKEVEEIKSKNLDPDVNAKLLKNQDLLKEMEKEIKQLGDTKLKLQGYLKNNNESMKQYENTEIPSQLEGLMRENKELKKKTQSERRKEEEIRQEEIKAQQNYINLKMKARRIEEGGELTTDLKALKNQTISKEAILETTLQEAVQALKNKKKEIETKQERERIEKTKRREQLFAHNETLLSKMKGLEMEKVKLRQELNKYEALSAEIEHSKRKDRDRDVKKKDSQSIEVQTDSKQSLLVLRRDYAGVIGKNRFDDRLSVLNTNFNTKISRVIVYQNTKSIAAIKFQYFDEDNNTFQTQMIVPAAYLNKCKKKSFQVSRTNDFFKLFKAKFNSLQKRISKIQIVSNLNIKSEFGDKKPFEELSKQQNVYGFDISINELPVSMFGSINQVGNEWYLESLGAEIKGINQKIKV